MEYGKGTEEDQAGEQSESNEKEGKEREGEEERGRIKNKGKGEMK